MPKIPTNDLILIMIFTFILPILNMSVHFLKKNKKSFWLIVPTCCALVIWIFVMKQ